MADDRVSNTTERIGDGVAGATLSDLEVLTRLNEVGNRCVRERDDFSGCLEAVLDAAIFLTGADKGTLQLREPRSAALAIQAQRGFDRRFLDFFGHVREGSACACGAALATGARIVVPDIATSELFADGETTDMLLGQGVRAVQCTPLTSSSGHVLGAIATHFSRPTRLAERELHFLDLLARQAADYIERKEAERQLIESRLQLARITAHTAACIAQCSRERRFLFVNETCASFLGSSSERIVGRPIREVMGEAAFELMRPYIDRVLAGERVEFEADIPFPGAGLRHVHCIFLPDVDAHLAVRGWIATTTDLTERKRLEERLRLADRHKDEFLATLAHELRNALAPMRYALAVAQKSGPALPQHSRAEAVIERQIVHMTRLLDDLLDVSRITRAKVELKMGATDLSTILAAAIDAVRPLLDAKRHTLSIDVPKELVRLHADADRLTQVFSNLLINAAKYTDPGGRIELRATEERGDLVVVLRDNGIGIAPELLPHVFTLFAQSSRGKGRSDGGIGVGLALVRGLVELHGGRVEAASDGPDQGSQFTVRLPLRTVEPAHAGRTAHPQPREGIGLTVLLVDDNREAADTCAALLELSGHRVQVAYTGRAAVDLAERIRPQALVLDIGLPDIDGYTLAERVRAAEWGRSALLIAVTGFGQEEDRARALAAGFDHHLTKPVTGVALESLLAVAGRIPAPAAAQSAAPR